MAKKRLFPININNPNWCIAGTFRVRKITGILAGIIFISFFFNAIEKGHTADIEANQSSLDNNADMARDEVEYLFKNLEDRLSLSISDLISTYHDHVPANQDEHLTKVMHLNRANPFLQTINYIDDNQRIRFVSPLEPNRNVIGLKIGLSSPKAALEEALSIGKPVLSHPFVIIQGQMGYSLMIPHEKGGAFEVVFKAESVFGSHSPFRMHQGMALKVFDGDETVYASPEFKEESDLAIKTKQSLLGRTFRMELIPTAKEGEKVLLVGSELDYPPFALVNKKGEAEGFSVDLFKAVAQVMGLKIQFRVGPWEEVRTALERGEIDALPLVSYSEEREKVFDFTSPHTTSDAVAFIRKGDKGIRKESDLRGKRIIVMQSDATHDYLLGQGIAENLLTVKSIADALRLLASGEGDLAFLPRLTGLLKAREIGLDNMAISGPRFNVYGRGYGFAVSEGNAELLAKLNLGLSLLKTSGKYDEIYDKWFGLVDPRGISRDTILKYTVTASIAFLSLLSAALLWSWSLRREVKQRRIAEAELNKQRIFVEAVLENIQDGIVACDDQGLLAVFNRATRIFHGVDLENLPPEEWASHYDLLLADGVTPMAKEDIPLFRAFRGEKVVNQEMVIAPREGKKRTLVTNGLAMIDEKGEKLGAVVSMHDITDRRKAEEALKLSEQRLQMVVDTVPVVLVMKDFEGRHLLVNHKFEEVTGIKREDAIGKMDVDIFPPQIAAEIRRFDKILLASGKENMREEEIPNPDGTIHTFYSRKVPVFNEKDKITGLVLAALDITEKKRVERELLIAKEAAESANKAKSLFLANMSHELRTPLNAILGFSEMLGRDRNSTEDQQEKLAIINRSGEHLLNMINDVLDLSKVEAGRVEPEPVAFDLPLMLQDLGQMFEVRARKAGLRFKMELDGNLNSYINADIGKIRQILINLLGNAVTFTSEGYISLRARTDSVEGDPGITVVQLEVKDSGRGIKTENMEHIFEPFVQTGEHIHPDKSGTGLGLSITKSFVELLSGEISVESKKGQGSLFRVRIPATIAKKEDLVSNVRNKLNVLGLAPDQPIWRILVVEDNSENRKLLVSMLEESGFETMEAENGEEAVDLFIKRHPHFIWMDMRMPVMDGYEAARRIRSLPGGDEVKIVAITASAFREQRDDIIKSGCDDVVHKPFIAYEIFETMEQLLGVKYIYEEVGEKEIEPSILLTDEMMTQLSDDVRETLREAAQQLDISATEEAIKLIRIKNPSIADGLQYLAKEFRFEKILELLEKRK